MNAVGYIRVSTAEQAQSGLGLDAQRVAIVDAARRLRLDLVGISEDAGISAVARCRPQLLGTLQSLEEPGGPRVLLVAKLDRLVRSVPDYGRLVERAKARGWVLIVLDTPNAETPIGELTQVLAAGVAQMERRLISLRTREALEAARARGVVLGRPPGVGAELGARIAGMWREGLTTVGIAERLTAEGLPSPAGRERWNDRTVAMTLRRVLRVPHLPHGPRRQRAGARRRNVALR